MAWPVGLRSDPLFSRAVNYGAPCPIIFRPFLAPNAHRKPPLWTDSHNLGADRCRAVSRVFFFLVRGRL